MSELVDANGDAVESTPVVEQESAVEVATEGAPLPEYDFGAGDLGTKVAQLKKSLKAAGLAPAEEGEQATEGAPPVPPAEALKGSDIDWSEFDLDPNYAHFYPQATFTVTGQGPKWVVVINEYETFEKPYAKRKDKDGRPAMDKAGMPLNLGDYITSRLSSPPDAGCGPWKLGALLPGTMGNGAVMLQRQVPIVLPDPKMLETETKAAPTTDEGLAETDAAATAWAAEGVPTEAEVEGARDAEAPSIAEQIASDVIDGPDTENA